MNFIDILFYLFFLITPFFNGLYFEKNFACGVAALLVILFGELFRKDKELKGTKWVWIIAGSILAVTNLTYVINWIFYDEVRTFILIVWGNIQLIEMLLAFVVVYLRLNRLKNDKAKFKSEIKYMITSVIASTVIMALLSFVPQLYREGRFEGTFYYANTCAIFLFAGIALLYNFKFEKKKKMHNVFRWIFIALNLYALIRTYSRWSYAIVLIYIFYEFCRKIFNKNDSNKKMIIKLSSVIITTLIIVFGGFEFLKFNSPDERLNLDLVLHDFELRQSYLVEANDIIKEYPFGLGYEGYLEHQLIKENKYILRLVHNLPYQIVLNYGAVTFFFALVILNTYITICKNNKKLFDISNIILVLIFIHSLLDIDFSFLAIDNLLLAICVKNLFDEKE